MGFGVVCVCVFGMYQLLSELTIIEPTINLLKWNLKPILDRETIHTPHDTTSYSF